MKLLFKKYGFLSFVFLALLSSCSEDEQSNDMLVKEDAQQVLPSSIESIEYVDSSNEYVQAFQENYDNTAGLNLDESKIELVKSLIHPNVGILWVPIVTDQSDVSSKLVVLFQEGNSKEFTTFSFTNEYRQMSNGNFNLNVTIKDTKQNLIKEYSIGKGDIQLNEKSSENRGRTLQSTCVLQEFGLVDINGDGSISQAEWAMTYGGSFDNGLDSDGDGSLSQTEYSVLSCVSFCVTCERNACLAIDTCKTAYLLDAGTFELVWLVNCQIDCL